MWCTPVGLEPLEHRVAVPRVEDPRDGVRPRRLEVPHDAEAEEHRARRRAAGASRSATKSSTAVSTPLRGPPSLRRRARVRQPAARAARDRRGTGPPLAAGLRVPGLGGDRAGVEVVVAPAVRPADVVEQQQRQRRARRPLADQPQLLADREVVVVAVDHHRVGQRDLAQRVQARRADQLELRMPRSSATRSGCGAGSIAVTRAPDSAAQATSTRVRSPAYAPISTTDRAPAASRHGSGSSAVCASDVPQRAGSCEYGSTPGPRHQGATGA